MNKRNLLVALVFAVSVVPVTGRSQEWRIGVEQEVDINFYATLVEEFRGWRIWRFDERAGHTCAAVRPAAGLPHPVPAGYTVQMTRGGSTPYIDIRAYSNGDLMGGIRTFHFGDPKVQVRREGERFWTEVALYSEIVPFDGQVIEVNAESWEYAALDLGRLVERASLDLSHMKEAVVRAQSCATSP